MRRIAMLTQTSSQGALPRGWVVLGAALLSWFALIAVWAVMSQIFGLVSSAI